MKDSIFLIKEQIYSIKEKLSNNDSVKTTLT